MTRTLRHFTSIPRRHKSPNAPCGRASTSEARLDRTTECAEGVGAPAAALQNLIWFVRWHTAPTNLERVQVESPRFPEGMFRG